MARLRSTRLLRSGASYTTATTASRGCHRGLDAPRYCFHARPVKLGRLLARPRRPLLEIGAIRPPQLGEIDRHVERPALDARAREPRRDAGVARGVVVP